MPDAAALDNSQLAKLCSICENIFDHWDDVLREEREDKYINILFPYYKDAHVWLAAVQDGCALCRAFYSSCREELTKLFQCLPGGAGIEMGPVRVTGGFWGDSDGWFLRTWLDTKTQLAGCDPYAILVPRAVGKYIQ
jgi:hypothetical protein